MPGGGATLFNTTTRPLIARVHERRSTTDTELSGHHADHRRLQAPARRGRRIHRVHTANATVYLIDTVLMPPAG